MAESSIVNVSLILPELFLVFTSMVLLISGAFAEGNSVIRQISMSKVFFFITLFFVAITPSVVNVNMGGMFITSGFTTFCKILVLLGAVLSLYLSLGYYREHSHNRVNEFPVLIMLSVLGMMMMISANSLLVLYMGLELQSLSLYILASIHKEKKKSSEAGLKYFVLGALSSGLILYGCSLIYGFSGTINFDVLKTLYADTQTLPIGVLVGLVFLISGICFKISAVPFHMWTPDVYEGSPMPVTAFFAVAPKIAAMAMFVRLVIHPFGAVVEQWQQVIIFVSVASMIVGALGAMQQTNIKRLIAYSSIGHMGYILVGLAAASPEGVKAILIYLVIYMTLSVGIFACIMMIRRRKDGNSEDISSFSGLAKSRPVMALVVAVIMLSMAGIPPFAGFFGKFFIFFAAVKQGLYTLAVIGVLSSVIAAFYYLRIVKIMYFDEAIAPLDKNVQPEMQYIALGAALFNVVFFIGFSPFVTYAHNAASWLF